MSNDLINVPAWGMELVSLERDGAYWVAITPFCQALGIDERRQRRRIIADETFAGCLLRDTRSIDHEPVFFLRWDMVTGWLMTISPNRVKADAKAALIRYRRECFRILHAHFFGPHSQLPSVGANDLPPSLRALPAASLKFSLTPEGRALRERGRENFLSWPEPERQKYVAHLGRRFRTYEAWQRAVDLAEF
jgi:hypothetical protein